MKLDKNEFKAIGLSSLLIILNIVLMLGLARIDFISSAFAYIWNWAIVGVIFYGILLTGGSYIAKRGIKNSDIGMAGFGAAILQLAYGSFGAAIVAGFSIANQIIILGITGIITAFIALIAALYVYWTDRNLRAAGTYSNYAFLGLILIALIGTAYPPLMIIGFLFALTGFLLYLVFEIWQMKTQAVTWKMSGIGIYIAYAGVFIHILQMVARQYLQE